MTLTREGRMNFSFDGLWLWASDVNNWFGMALFTGIVALLMFCAGLWVNDRLRLERAMAKKGRNRKLLGILEAALDTHARQELITYEEKDYALKKFRKALNMPRS